MEQTEYSDRRIKLVNADWYKYYKHITPGSCGLAIVDPNWGVLTERVKWDTHCDLNHLEMTLDHILSPNGQFVFFGNLRLIVEALNTFKKFDLRTSHIWRKYTGMPISRWQPIPTHEEILIMKRVDSRVSDCIFNPKVGKGDPYKRVNTTFNVPTRRMKKGRINENKDGSRWIRSVISAPSKPSMVASERTNHETQKSTELIQKIISVYSDKDSLIVSPFVGSGTDLVSSFYQGRAAIGTELDPPIYKEACKRLQLTTVQINLFQTTNTESTLKQEILL